MSIKLIGILATISFIAHSSLFILIPFLRSSKGGPNLSADGGSSSLSDTSLLTSAEMHEAFRRLKNEVLTMLPDKTRIRVRADPDKIDKKAMKELRELEKGPSDGDEAAI